MRDLNDANESSQNIGDVINVDEQLEKVLDSNKAPVETSDTTDSKSISEEETSTSQRQQNRYFEKETESFEIIENIHQSFNAFQETIVDTDKSAFLNDGSYDHVCIIEKSPTLCISGHLLSNTSKPRIHVITETTEGDDDINEKVAFLNDNFNDYVSMKERSPTSCTSNNLLPNTLEPKIHVITETNERYLKEIEIIPTRATPTMESSTSGSTIIPKCENWPPISNARFHKREMPCDVFKEDDDWNIYQPGFVTNDNTESLHESRFSFERLKNENAEYFAKNNSKSSIDYVSCQRIHPYTGQGTRCSPSNNSVNNRGIFPEWIVKRMLREVKEFFLGNPVEVSSNLDDLERKAWIITSPFFNRDFASKHDLPFPTFAPLQGLNLPKDPAKVRRLFLGYEFIIDLGISEDDFFRYISFDNQRLARTSPWKWYEYSESNPLIDKLDHIQEQVGTDIFNMIYEQLRTDERYQALFRNKELLINALLFWYAYNDKRMELLSEQYKNTSSNFLSQNQADYTSHVSSEDVVFSRTNEFQSTSGRLHVIKTPNINNHDSNSYTNHETSEDIFASGTNAYHPSSTSRSHVIKTPGLNEHDSNSCVDEGKGLHKILKNNQSLTDLFKVQSIEPNDVLETELKCSPMMQPTNEDNKETRSSFDSLQDHSNKLNGCSYQTSTTPPYTRNFDDDEEEKPRKMHLVTSRDSPNNEKDSSSDQNFIYKSRELQSEYSYEVLEDISNGRP